MWWSISEAKRFRRCQRQWYYKNIVASAVSRDPRRREAHRLSQLESLQAWRGNLVDQTITRVLIPALRQNKRITLEQVKRFAMRLFDRQLEYARTHRVDDAHFNGKDAGDAFAALHAFEYDGVISDDAIAEARSEVCKALSNLFMLQEIKAPLRQATQLIAQRALVFAHSDVSVRAVPDLIAFYKEDSPVIIDWKVHTYGLQDAWLQLAVYVLALSRCRPHSDFPVPAKAWEMGQIRILEVQLLKNELREHKLEEEDFERTESYIAESASQITLLRDNRNFGDLKPEEFLVTAYPETCDSCPFRRICWESKS